jgi:hypothetical protein
MAKKCPPGVICIENMTLFFIISLLLLILYLVYNKYINFSNSTDKKLLSSNIEYNLNVNENNGLSRGLYPQPGSSYSNIENDVLLNPYQAPLRDNRIFPNSNIYFANKIPINIKTQSYDTNYRQIGILTRIGGNKETIIPLMGRPLITNRDKWNFYAMSENNNMLKLPVSFKGKKCMSDNGCDDVYTGDTINVDGYNDSFKVTTYENNTPQYIPYI